MKPNIDRRGRIARAVSGAVCVGLAGGVFLRAWPESLLYRSLLAGLLIAAAGFQFFEAKKSWCVARACGIKTPM